MKILVTGANGYIGQGVIKKLLDSQTEVIATDRKIDKIDRRATAIQADLFDVQNPFEYFGHPDALLHLAWRDGFQHNSTAHICDLNKHYDLISQLCKSGLRQICVLGSMHEIGFFEGCIDENTPTNPQSLYGISKNALRQATELLCKENNTLFQWIRGFYIVGNAEQGSSVFSKLYEAEKAGEKRFPFTMGTNLYDFIDYDKFCDQVISVVKQKNVTGIINCCSGYPQRLSERVEAFILENNFKIKLDYGAFPDRPYDSKAIWGNNDKIQEILKNKK